MEKQEIFVNSSALSYQESNQPLSLQNSIDTEGDEPASVFYLNLNHDGKIYLPLSIFASNMTPLRVIVKYLKENLSKTNKQISEILDRDMRTLWATYKSVEKVKLKAASDSSIKVPVEIFSNPSLSAFESLVQYLKNLDMNYSQIARLLQKDPRTVWTVYFRAKNKMNQKQKP